MPYQNPSSTPENHTRPLPRVFRILATLGLASTLVVSTSCTTEEGMLAGALAGAAIGGVIGHSHEHSYKRGHYRSHSRYAYDDHYARGRHGYGHGRGGYSSLALG